MNHLNKEPLQQSNTLVYFKLIVATFFWGGTWVAAKILVQEVPPFTAAFVRFVIAVIALGFILYQQEGFVQLSKDNLKTSFWLGFTGIFLYSFFFLNGLRHINAGRGALVIALNPVLIALISWLWFKDNMTVLKGFGIVTALVGCVLVISDGHPQKFFQGEVGMGELLIIGCVFSWAAYTFIGRHATLTMSPLATTFYASLVGCVLLGIASVSEAPWSLIGHFSTNAWLALLFLGLLGTALSYTWFTDGVKQIGAARAGPFINLTPVFGVLLSALILDERLHIEVLTGGALTILGVMMTVWTGKTALK